jgi:dTDP-4-dehydrorhamnose reductase
MRIAVIGATGQLGAAIVHASATRHDVQPFTHAALDITDDDAVQREMAQARPDCIVNCAGFHWVDAAETQPVDALRLNAFAVRSLARAACTLGARLVHYSTDFVFRGDASTPMTEDVKPNPRSAYAASKLLGEWFALEVPRAWVLRVESLFGVAPGGPDKGSLAAIVKGLRAGGVVKVFGDRTVSPTYIHDAAAATLALLERDAEPGLYHCVNSGSATWLDVAQEAARLLGVTPQFEVMRVAEVELPAARPQYCALSNAKLEAAIGYVIPTWQDALRRYLAPGSKPESSHDS